MSDLHEGHGATIKIPNNPASAETQPAKNSWGKTVDLAKNGVPWLISKKRCLVAINCHLLRTWVKTNVNIYIDTGT